MDDATKEKLPLTAHLEELRKRLIRIFIAIGIGFGVCYLFKDPLFNVLTQPLIDVLPKNSYMIYTNLPEAFFIYMKIAFFASLFLTAPYTLYQVWLFTAPGLYKKEKMYVIPFVLSSSLLFIVGILFGYYIDLPPAF
jgi:sec-independent protein translocase protein TatC